MFSHSDIYCIVIIRLPYQSVVTHSGRRQRFVSFMLVLCTKQIHPVLGTFDNNSCGKKFNLFGTGKDDGVFIKCNSDCCILKIVTLYLYTIFNDF